MRTQQFYRIYKYPVYFIAALLMAYLVAPTLIIAPLSFNFQPYFTYPIKEYSLRWYEEVLTTQPWNTAFRNSFFVAMVSTVWATALGTMGAVGLAGLPQRIRNYLNIMLLSPIFIPIIVFAVGFYYFAARVGVVNTLGALIWAHIVLGLPFVVILVSASLERFDRDFVRAAQSLGAGPLTTFRRITLPLIAPGVLAGAIFAFVTSWDEIVTALFVAGGPENHTLPRRLWAGLRDDLSPAIIAAATILSALSLVLMIVVETLRTRSASAGRSEKQ